MRTRRIRAIAATAAGLSMLIALVAITGQTQQPTTTSSPQFEQVAEEQVVHCPGPRQTRVSQCKLYPYLWNLRQNDPVTGPIIGTAGLTLSISEAVNSRRRAWSVHYVAEFGGFSGKAEAGVTATVLGECRGQCTAPGAAVLQNVPVFNGTVLEGDIPISSLDGGISISSQIVNVFMFHPLAVGTGTTAEDGINNRLGPVRCDSGVGLVFGGRPTPGCVFPEFTPTLVLNETPGKAPAPLHAAFVADAQNRLPGRLGHPGSGLPLHRQSNKVVRDDNRTEACKGFVARTPPGTDLALVDSCDEYPYAGTLESKPGVTQIGHVPNGDNGNAGSQYSSFIRAVRLIAGDAFYVDPNL